jgi:TRAP-type mannitol/chloroaromatic compound transport system permease small subunit
MKTTLLFLNKIIDIVGWICVVALMLMIINVFIDVFVRYVVIDMVKYFDIYLWYDEHFSWLGGIGMQELEWHWFSVMFLMGLGYTLRENGHVRVDVIYDTFAEKKKSWINIIGALVFAIPFCSLMVYDGWDFFLTSFISEENKGDPGSLPRLWPGKLIIPVAFAFLILSLIAVMIKEYLVITDQYDDNDKPSSDMNNAEEGAIK